MDEERERIICSAIWIRNGKRYAHQPNNVTLGIVIAGLRHAHIMVTMSEMELTTPELIASGTMGFITSNYNFLGRKEAMYMAVKTGQVNDEDLIMPNIGLDSSDLY